MAYWMTIVITLGVIALMIFLSIKKAGAEVKKIRVADRLLSEVDYEAVKVNITRKIKDRVEIDARKFDDVLKREMDKCGGQIIIKNFAGGLNDGQKILEEFLEKGC